jgi:type VI secretion system secreted protein VgrG
MRTAIHRPIPSSLIRRVANPKALAVVALGAVTFLGFTSLPASAATAINLGSATPYAVVAGTTITNTGSSVISGDIGLSPGTSITGFPPGTVSGTTDAADALSLAAQTSSTAAYGVAASSTPFTTVAGGTLGGTLAPGVYQSASALALNGPVTLNGGGNPDAVFIFQTGSTLTTASGSAVVLENGAQACNVFWQVGSSATLGTGTSFSGTILAMASVTADTGASVQGRLLAQTGAVTLDDNTVTVPVCSLAVTTTTTTAPTTTTTLHKKPTTTTTKPVVAHPKGSPGSGTSSGTIIPVGAPATGEGGMAGSSFSPAGLIGLIALAISASAVSIAVRIRRRQ